MCPLQRESGISPSVFLTTKEDLKKLYKYDSYSDTWQSATRASSKVTLSAK